MRDFFRNYSPERFDLHETSAAEGNWFAAGYYWFSNSESPISIYMRLRLNDVEWELREIQITRRFSE
jgi:hypothetical protein